MSYSQETVRRIWRRSRRKCFYCGTHHRLSDYGLDWEADHVFPRSRGGSDDVGNLVVACIYCNRSKGDKNLIGKRLKNDFVPSRFW